MRSITYSPRCSKSASERSLQLVTAACSRCATCRPVATSSTSEANDGAHGHGQDRDNEPETSDTRTAMATTLRGTGSARIRARHVRWRGALRVRPTGGVEALELLREGLGRCVYFA